MGTESSPRDALLARVADSIPRATDGRHVFVAIDGVDGAGKTVFAEELVELLNRDGRVAIRVSMDGFHHTRDYRYQQGPASPIGFYEDSFDYDAFERHVLLPLRPGGSWRFLPAAHDVSSDELLVGPLVTVTTPTIVVVDGLFLHRPWVRDYWDYSIFLDADFAQSVPRMAQRDGSHPDPDDPSNDRYVGAQRIYFAECEPKRRASIVVDNNDLANPVVVS